MTSIKSTMMQLRHNGTCVITTFPFRHITARGREQRKTSQMANKNSLRVICFRACLNVLHVAMTEPHRIMVSAQATEVYLAQICPLNTLFEFFPYCVAFFQTFHKFKFTNFA